MKKKVLVMMAILLLLTLATGCKKNNNIPAETAVPSTMETIAITQQTELETTAPTVDALRDPPSAYENTPEETMEASEETESTEAAKPTETTPPATEAPKPTESDSPASQVLPGDNWETPDL